jgi:hypothetical protein
MVSDWRGPEGTLALGSGSARFPRNGGVLVSRCGRRRAPPGGATYRPHEVIGWGLLRSHSGEHRLKPP